MEGGGGASGGGGGGGGASGGGGGGGGGASGGGGGGVLSNYSLAIAYSQHRPVNHTYGYVPLRRVSKLPTRTTSTEVAPQNRKQLYIL